MKVWIVSFTTGEYSGREVFTDCCFVDEAKATEYAKAKNADVFAAIAAQEKIEPKQTGWGAYSQAAMYNFNGKMHEVRLYRGEQYDHFTVSGPFDVEE
jgi:hypothetical protein